LIFFTIYFFKFPVINQYIETQGKYLLFAYKLVVSVYVTTILRH